MMNRCAINMEAACIADRLATCNALELDMMCHDMPMQGQTHCLQYIHMIAVAAIAKCNVHIRSYKSACIYTSELAAVLVPTHAETIQYNTMQCNLFAML